MESVDQLLSWASLFAYLLLPIIMIYVVQHIQYLLEDPDAVLTLMTHKGQCVVKIQTNKQNPDAVTATHMQEKDLHAEPTPIHESSVSSNMVAQWLAYFPLVLEVWGFVESMSSRQN